MKISAWFFVDTDKLILKYIWKEKNPRIAKYFQKRIIKWEKSFYSILRLTVEL